MEKNYDNMYDMIIVGGGPAGLSAAIYMARAKYKTLVIEKEKFGGQITITSEVVNYPGVFKTSGKELTSDMQKQATAFGAEFTIGDVVEMDLSKDIKTIKTTNGEYKALGVILALGASPRQIGFAGEEEFKGRGVAYCATCDGEFFQDMPVYVVGGGFAAVEEGIFLTKYASNVKMIVREEDFTCAKTVAEKVYNNPKITVEFNSEVEYVKGDGILQDIKVVNNVTGESYITKHEDGFGVFVFAGYQPNTSWLEGVELAKGGYIITNEDQETNLPGVYGAGDVCVKELRQVVTAVSDGAIAATRAEKYIESLHTKLNIPAFEIIKKDVEEKEETTSIQTSQDDEKFISDEMKEQLQGVFSRFQTTVTVKAVVDNSTLGLEMGNFIAELNGISTNVKVEKEALSSDQEVSYLEIIKENGESSNIRYYTMPGGHEFNSFILALYNVAGPGQEITDDQKSKIATINNELDIKVFISLSCTMCPEVVVATQKIASQNNNIHASALDLAHFPEVKKKHKIMSVPCMIINDEVVHFGKKDIDKILELIA